MKYYLTLWMKMTFTHICVQVASFVIGISVFMFLLHESWGATFMSVILTAFYAGFIYRNAWHVGKRDIKSYSEHTPYWFKGLILSLPVVVITAILSIIWVGIGHVETGAQFFMTKLFDYWNFTAEGLMLVVDGKLSMLYWIVIFVVCPMSASLGYIAGIKKFSITDRILYPIVYRKKK